ncbi:hypothetical protein ACVBEH_28580, partial [Roseateles sp. GG27B]
LYTRGRYALFEAYRLCGVRPQAGLLSPQPSRSICSTAKPALANACDCKAAIRRDLFISSAKA